MFQDRWIINSSTGLAFVALRDSKEFATALAILGGLICATILFFPGGIIQLIDWIDRKLPGRKKQA